MGYFLGLKTTKVPVIKIYNAESTHGLLRSSRYSRGDQRELRFLGDMIVELCYTYFERDNTMDRIINIQGCAFSDSLLHLLRVM